ncbi:hypothetical protein [Bordetella genomosp. 10]|uniref:hypothetical protein n=1 Tax=Bordetella genomosp. 10 TaxID=1416804 RepID=UPI0015C59350|nr:hypothetical protein [Bordetella genomosp. 10]
MLPQSVMLVPSVKNQKQKSKSLDAAWPGPLAVSPGEGVFVMELPGSKKPPCGGFLQKSKNRLAAVSVVGTTL